MAVSMFATSAFAADFTDTVDHANADAAEIMNALDIMEGYGDNIFGVDDPLTREQFCIMIVRALVDEDDIYISSDKDSFTDVSATSPYRAYIDTAARLGYMSGYGNKVFGPKDPMTYVQVATVIMNALGYEINDFSWPSGVVTQAVNLDLFDNVEFDSVNNVITRGHAAQMLVNAFDSMIVYKNNAGIYIEGNKNFLYLLGYRVDIYDCTEGLNAGHRYLAYKENGTGVIKATDIEVSTSISLKFTNGVATYGDDSVLISNHALYVDGVKIDYDKKSNYNNYTLNTIVYNGNVIALTYWSDARTYWSGDSEWTNERTNQWNAIITDDLYIPGISTVTFHDGLKTYSISNEYVVGKIDSIGSESITLTNGDTYKVAPTANITNGDYVILFFAADDSISYFTEIIAVQTQ